MCNKGFYMTVLVTIQNPVLIKIYILSKQHMKNMNISNQVQLNNILFTVQFIGTTGQRRVGLQGTWEFIIMKPDHKHITDPNVATVKNY